MGIVEKIAIVEFECGVCEDVNEYMNDFNAGMINLAYDWANQKPFIEIMKTTSAMEGKLFSFLYTALAFSRG